jgi:hypothetical protein
MHLVVGVVAFHGTTRPRLGDRDAFDRMAGIGRCELVAAMDSGLGVDALRLDCFGLVGGGAERLAAERPAFVGATGAFDPELGTANAFSGC